MDFVANQQPQIETMLKDIGIDSIEQLFEEIPKQLKKKAPLFDDGLSEFEGMELFKALADKNTFSSFESYLGGGAYEHHVPALVQAVTSKSEFLTAYTPYQPEASQGMLQAIFEFQSAICALTGLDASNASVYDGASAAAEGLLMALRLNKNRQKVLISGALNPNYRKVIEQYLESHAIEVKILPFSKEGKLIMSDLEAALDENTAAVLLQSPNFFGVVEDAFPCFEKVKHCGACAILCSDLLSFGLLQSAKDLGADLAVGDCQSLGIPLQFGGPYAGFIACKEGLVRQLPGRIVGETLDTKKRRGFVLTLQAREQHIRREKATSNICTNQALAALASLVAILWYGPKGLYKLALTNYQRANFLKNELRKISGVKVFGEAETFNEFAVSFGKPFSIVQKHFRISGIEPGIDLGNDYPEMKDYCLVCVTETKDLAKLNRYIEAAKELMR